MEKTYHSSDFFNSSHYGWRVTNFLAFAIRQKIRHTDATVTLIKLILPRLPQPFDHSVFICHSYFGYCVIGDINARINST